MKLNKYWYQHVYPDVQKSRLNPINHYYEYGIKEKRIGSRKDFPFELNIFDLIIYVLYIIYLVFHNFNFLKLFSASLKQLIIFYESIKFKKFLFDFLVILPWFSGGVFEAFRIYSENYYNYKKMIVFRGIKDFDNSIESPMILIHNSNHENEKQYIIYFPLKFIKNSKNISKKIVHIHHNLGIEYFTNNLILLNFKKIYYFIHDYYLFTQLPHLYLEKERSSVPLAESIKLFPNKLINLDLYIQKVDNFVSPSLSMTHSMKNILKNNVITLYHPEVINLENFDVKKISLKSTYKVGIIGNLGYYKGLSQVINLINYCENENLNFEFHHFGESLSLKQKKYINYSNLNRNEIKLKMVNLSIDFCWLPFQCEETYSFTLSDVMLAKMPLVASDINVIRERCINRPNTILIPIQSNEEDAINYFNLLVKEKKLNLDKLSNHNSSKIKLLRRRNFESYLFLFE